MELQPSHFGAYSGMGLCYIAINDLPAALTCLRRALALNPRLEQIRDYVGKLEVCLHPAETHHLKSFQFHLNESSYAVPTGHG